LGKVKRLAIAVAVCAPLICSPAQAKTFVGVLWPLFGPLPAVGLVELAGELRNMPDVEVKTYMHQSWPSLVEDIDRQPEGTHTVVIGYSLGANNSVFVANKAKYVDLIIALQPSIFSWNPPLQGKVGRMIEIYNPNPWMTFGGMGSKKLVGENIEYIANNDTHPGAQFNSQFRHLVKREVRKFSDQDRLEMAEANVPKPLKLAKSSQPAAVKPAEERSTRQQGEGAAHVPPPVADAKAPRSPSPVKPVDVAQERPKPQPRVEPRDQTAFLDRLSRSVNSGDLFGQRRLTMDDMKRYAQRTYHGSRRPDVIATAAD
jgi:hypothetical protein